MHILCLRKSNHRYLALRTPSKLCPIPPHRGHGRPKGHLARRILAGRAKWVSRTVCSELLCRHLAYGHVSDSTSAVSFVFTGSRSSSVGVSKTRGVATGDVLLLRILRFLVRARCVANIKYIFVICTCWPPFPFLSQTLCFSVLGTIICRLCSTTN